MIIKNISSKIINIGTEILMPDKQLPVAEDVAELPAIKAFAEKGYVVLIEEPAKAAKSAAEKMPEQGEDKQPEGEAATGEPAAEVKAPKRTLRRTTTTTTAATPEA